MLHLDVIMRDLYVVEYDSPDTLNQIISDIVTARSAAKSAERRWERLSWDARLLQSTAREGAVHGAYVGI